MQATRLILLILAAMGCMSVHAQTTSLVEKDSVRFVQGSLPADSNAFMRFGLTRDNRATYVTSVSATESVQVIGEINPQAEHVGQTGDLFMVIRKPENTWWMRNESGTWQQWGPPKRVPELVPFMRNVQLQSSIEAIMLSGMITEFSGDIRLFIGYSDADGELYYNPGPHRITITPQSTEDLARAFFASSISTPIVQNRCIVCHVSGGAASGTPHIFVRTTNANHLNINYSEFLELLAARGKTYILSKSIGGQGHGGGVQITNGSQQYQDLDEFLTLLEQTL